MLSVGSGDTPVSDYYTTRVVEFIGGQKKIAGNIDQRRKGRLLESCDVVVSII